MRDLASGSGAAPGGEQPLPPTVTSWSGVDGRAPLDDGPILPPFFPSGVAEVEQFAPTPEDESAESFPMDAFFIPEGADHVPAGVDPAGAQPAEHRERRVEAEAIVVAHRLENLAKRLRVEGAAAVAAKLATGDTLDKLAAELLAAYLGTPHT